MENTTFTYSYSAERKSEVEKIRSKYLPKKENKIERLRKLDNKVLYFAGAMDGFYLATTEDATAAVDVYFEDAGEGAVRLYFMDGQLKTYISAYEGAKNDGTPTQTLTLVPQQDRAITWKYIPAIRGFACTIKIGGTADNHDDGEAKTYYIGTYNTYKTFSLSETSYVLNDDGTTKSGFDVSNFVAHFGTSVDASTVSDEDKIAYEKDKLTVTDSIKTTGETALPAFGKIYGNVEIAWALDKTYDFAKVEGGKLVITATPAEATVIKLLATVKSGDKTALASFEITVSTMKITTVDTPAKNTAYKFYLDQVKANKTIFFKGEMNGYYYASTEDVLAATELYLEAAETEGEYYVYFMNGNVKTYLTLEEALNSKTGKMVCNVVFKTDKAAASKWVYNTTIKSITSTLSVDGAMKTYYLGTYNNYTTFSASELKYVVDAETGALTDAYGTSSFVAHFGIFE
jgi:hypothetical protein